MLDALNNSCDASLFISTYDDDDDHHHHHYTETSVPLFHILLNLSDGSPGPIDIFDTSFSARLSLEKGDALSSSAAASLVAKAADMTSSRAVYCGTCEGAALSC